MKITIRSTCYEMVFQYGEHCCATAGQNYRGMTMTTKRVHRVLMVFSLLLILMAIAGQSLKSSAAEENSISSSEFWSTLPGPEEILPSRFVNLVAKAEAGDMDAQYDLGCMYYDGNALYQDFEEAFKWYTAAAEQGHTGAQSRLGWMYITGKGVAGDVGMGIHWYTKAAEQGDSGCQFFLGSLYDSGAFVPQDYQLAIKWYTKAGEQGHVHAQVALGVMYYSGEGVPQDYKAAIKWYTMAAEQGLDLAQYELSFLYATGRGVEQDDEEAYKWLWMAAEQGNPEAIAVLRRMCLDERGAPKDNKKAFKWYSLAAKQGDVSAQYHLSYMYYNGEGVPKDVKEGLRWLKAAAEQGHAGAQDKLGIMHYNGEGVPKDVKEALRWWYKAAAEQGYVDSQSRLGSAYYLGEGVPQDYKEAARWFKSAAEHNDAGAQYMLGHMYFYGKGVPQDYVHGYKWLNLSAAQGQELAKEKRDIWKQDMTPGQIAEAQRLSREFRPKPHEPGPQDEQVPAARQMQGYGTGFFITSDGYLLTAYHVVKGADSVKVWKDGASIPSRIIRVDAANDIALLKADVTGVEALSVKSSLDVRSGQEVFTLGFPNVELQGSEAKYTQGHVSSLSGIGDDPRLFQISAAVQPGNSGGPLLDAEGQVVGLIVATLDHLTAAAVTGSLPQNVNYALKSSFVLSFLEVLPELSGRLSKSGAKGLSRPKIIEQSNKAVVMVLSY
jgi:uncharacterized protein